MQIGCSAPTSGPLIAPDSLARIATEAEMLGFRLYHGQRPCDDSEEHCLALSVQRVRASFLLAPVQQPIPIWVGGESAPALRRTVRYADCWYPVGTNPQFPMNTLSRFKAGMKRFCGFAVAGANPASVKVALRALVCRSARPRRTIDGEGEMFTGGTADDVGDIKALEDLRGCRRCPIVRRDTRCNARQHAPLPRRSAGKMR